MIWGLLYQSPLFFFTDAVLRAPTIGSMLMCLSASLIGVIVFLRKQSLLGEALSHAAYPGVVIGVILAGIFNISEDQQFFLTFAMMAGAFVSAFLGLWSIFFLERKIHVRSDTALCFVLSAFFGVGITLASQVQFTYTSHYRQVQAYLYGQAATMTDIHIFIYGTLAFLMLSFIIAFLKEIKTITFDRKFAKSLGFPIYALESMIFILIVLSVVIGIRSVGVVLMSAMIIAPATAARQFTNRFSSMLWIAPIFGMLSAFLGTYLSLELSAGDLSDRMASRVSLPTGPMIVIVASCICLIAILFAPERGLLLRIVRVARFRYRCVCENVLKTFWRIESNAGISLKQIAYYQSMSSIYLRFILCNLSRKGLLESISSQHYRLTAKGKQSAARIIRLHRLWEVYLANYMGVGGERVHRNAEEMEHILTPELENELTTLLNDPKVDPHFQPIPPKE